MWSFSNKEGAKNSGGKKKQDHYQPQRQGDRLLVLGGCTHMLMTSEITGHLPQCVVTQNQEPIRPAFTCTYLWLVVGLSFSHRCFPIGPTQKPVGICDVWSGEEASAVYIQLQYRYSYKDMKNHARYNLYINK